MSDVTRILSGIKPGNPHAAAQLMPLVYAELRKLAAHMLVQEKAGQTLDATLRAKPAVELCLLGIAGHHRRMADAHPTGRIAANAAAPAKKNTTPAREWGQIGGSVARANATSV